VASELSAWLIRRDVTNPIPGTVIGVNRNAGGVRALISRPWALSFGTLSLGTGVEVEIQRDDRSNWENDGGAKGALTLDQLERVRSGGAFTQLRLDFPNRFSVLGGIRYDRIRFSAEDRFLIRGNPDDSGTRTMDAISPSVGILATVTPSVELFTSVARSFESPTTTELTNRPSGAGGFNPDLEPQTGVSLEGGVRIRFRDNVALELTGFRTDLENQLVPFEVPSDPGRQYFRNAGTSHHTGLEASIEARPVEGAHVRVAYTKVDARFDRYQTDDGDFAGHRVPGLAPHRLDAIGTLSAGPVFLELRGLYQDAVPVDDAGTEEAAPYFLADVRAGLDGIRTGTLRLSPYAAVANVFDRSYTTSVVVNAFGGRFFEPGPGRTYRLGFEITWANRAP
jgi:iron complex outermembrane receptor protein